jgi:glutathione S-transferase
VEFTLYQNVHCPYSERARRALGEKGIYQHRIEVLWTERDALEQKTGSRSTPVAVHEKRVLSNSASIARYADRVTDGKTKLFPENLQHDIAEWERRANELLELTMPLAIPVWADVMTDSKDRDAFLQAQSQYGSYRELRNARLDHWRKVEAEWRVLDEVLKRWDYFLGDMTFADLAVYGSVYLAAQFHAFEVPEVCNALAAWYENIRTAGIMRDQEVLLGKSRREHDNESHVIDYTREDSRYGDPPHRPLRGADEGTF